MKGREQIRPDYLYNTVTFPSDLRISTFVVTMYPMDHIKKTVVYCFILVFLLTSCQTEAPKNPLSNKPLQSDVLITEVIDTIVEEKDSVIIHLGTFLGNEKRNYSGNYQSDSLNEIWKTDLGSGVTIVSASKGREVWKGAGWTGQPLIVEEKGEIFIIQGSFDHGLKKIRAEDGQVIWSYLYDDIIKGTGTLYVNDTAKDPNHRILIMQGSRLGNENHLSSKEVWSYRAISYFTGNEVWRMNIERGKSYSRDVDASALIVNDTAYIGLENGSFVVFNPSHTQINKNEDSVFHSPVIHKELKLYEDADIKTHRGNLVTEASPCRIGDRVYVASGSGHVYGYNMKTNQMEWDFRIGSDLDGTTIVTEDNCLLLPVEKQYIKGKGGILKLNPSLPDTACVEWFFPTQNKNYSSWKGGVIGSPAINEEYKSSFNDQSLAAFTGIDGYLYVIDPNELTNEMVEGPNKKNEYPMPEIIFKKQIGPSISTPVFSNGRLMAAGYKGIYVFKYEQGEFIQTDYRKGTFEATPAVHDGKVYIASRNGYFYCLGQTDIDEDLLASEGTDEKEPIQIDTPSNKEEYELSNQSIPEEKEKIKVKPEIKTIKRKVKKKLDIIVNDDIATTKTIKKISKKNNTSSITACVIVGSFSSEKNAVRLVEKLKDEGYPTAIILDKNKSRYHRVSIAGFESVEIAEKKLKDIRKEFSSAWITENF